MRIQKMLAACSALTAVAALTLAATPSAAQNRDQQNNHQAQNHGGAHGGNGGAATAGALGFVLGAAIADSQAHRSYAQAHMSNARWVSGCQSRYHSFDRSSGTYLGGDGRRRYCH